MTRRRFGDVRPTSEEATTINHYRPGLCSEPPAPADLAELGLKVVRERRRVGRERRLEGEGDPDVLYENASDFRVANSQRGNQWANKNRAKLPTGLALAGRSTAS